MEIRYITQPDLQLGRIVRELLETDPTPRKIILVSAFVGLQTALRFRGPINDLVRRGSAVRVVMGIDLGGTSREVLQEVCSWNVDRLVIKHRVPCHTFHPKVYLFEWSERADIIIGSNNLTEGGFFRNYEGSARISYQLPEDQLAYEQAQRELRRFLEPSGPTVYPLTENFLSLLIARNDIPTEAEARRLRSDGAVRRRSSQEGTTPPESPFGTEAIESPPPLPAAILEGLLEGVRRHRRELRQRPRPPSEPISSHPHRLGSERADVIAPASFYMTLPTLQGPNIPGEARIPLEAIELAQEFWGWPDEYERDEDPRGGTGRIYWNWRPNWRIWSVENPSNVVTQQVRMYMYENSSDFRFYVRPLVDAGGDLGDVVRITRIAQQGAEYECVLARRGTPEYETWTRFCTQPVRNSPRRFGYA